MVVTRRQVGGHAEYGFGTVQEIETYNEWHENSSIRGLIGAIGAVGDLSGEADTRTAEVTIQSVYRETSDGSHQPHGAALAMSPTTGTDVRLADNEIVDRVVVGDQNVFYPGGLYKSENVRVPFNTDHFDTDQGAYHSAVFGQSGAGKSGFAMLYLAGQMRHTNMAVLMVDPQSQFSNEGAGSPLSLQALARAQGRDVRVLSVANELQLPKSAPLFTKLLMKVGYFDKIHRIGNTSTDAVDALIHQLEKFLKSQKGWIEADATELVVAIATFLRDNAENIYKKGPASVRVAKVAQEVLDDPSDAVELFAPVLSTFAPTAMDGTRRTKIEKLLRDLIDPTVNPRPYFIINMATEGFGGADMPSDVREKLGSREAKSVILKSLFDGLERIAQDAYAQRERQRDDRNDSDARIGNLNTLIAFDEAHRYAPSSGGNDDVNRLRDLLARNARESRKYGIGWFYITQEPRQLHEDVWNQLTGFRVFGYGLGGQNARLMEEAAGGKDATGPRRGSAPELVRLAAHSPFVGLARTNSTAYPERIGPRCPRGMASCPSSNAPPRGRP
jgi:DNA helicase HerA-like ATPase